MNDFGLAVLLHAQEHRAPSGHPESSERLELAASSLEQGEWPVTWQRLPEEPASEEQLKAVHNPEFIRQLKTIAAGGGGDIDPDTYVTPSSFEAARIVAGAMCAAVRLSLDDKLPRSMVIGRPPGHHAESTRAMGFCLINQVAIAAASAVKYLPGSRVSIIDFDLHHGNGTQEIFYDRCDVQYISTHQYPFYPGTGAAGERGIHEGEGFTLNIPLAAGSGDTALLAAFDETIIPAVEQFAPQLILASAGFDGHFADPLGDLKFTPGGFEAVATRLTGLSQHVCAGRLVTFIEGGYNPEANRDSLMSYMKGLVAT